MTTETEQKIRRNTTKFKCGQCGYTRAIWLMTEEKYYCWSCGHKQIEIKSHIEFHEQIEYEAINQQIWQTLGPFDEVVGYKEAVYNEAFPYPIVGALEVFVKSPFLGDLCLIILSTAAIFKEVQDFLLENEIPVLSIKKAMKLNYTVISPEKPTGVQND